MTGWGQTKTDGEPVDELMVVDVSLIEPKVCKKQWPGLTSTVICAGGYGTTKGFCQMFSVISVKTCVLLTNV